MGKKSKVGKRRQDKFYHLAKETGYRARSAFKLIQLNRKFQFLQQSRVLIDLCAAPGGWLQVAAKHMPVSSIIIGIDLVPIKPIHNVITIQADITTSNCKQLLQRELKTWKVDCVLNDGAPNVGSAWIQDAFSQAQLVLSALKLATEFLRPGGWFITKIFRSKDYQALLNVFQQLFSKVHATKPQASRIESAEIFVVCKGYKIKGKPDPKLLDPKIVFQELEPEEKPQLSLQRLTKPVKSALGYPEGQNVLFQSASILDFVMSSDHMSMLASIHRLEFDKASEIFKKHPLTTEEIRQSCDDIKVLGLKELKQLIKWREKMKEFIDQVSDSESEKDKKDAESDNDEIDLTEVDIKIKELAKEEKAEVKRIIKHQRKQRKKIQERLSAQLETHKESEEMVSKREDMFSLQSIKSSQELDVVNQGEVISESEESEGEEDTCPIPREEDIYVSNDNDEESEVEGEGEGGNDDMEWENEEDVESLGGESVEGTNPLLVQLEDKSLRQARKTIQWFSDPVFSGLEERQEDVEEEMEKAVKRYELTGGKLIDRGGGKTSQDEEKNLDENNLITADENLESDVSDSDDATDMKDTQIGGAFEEESKPKIRKLDPEGLAIGALMVQSRKKRQELIESGYNKWTHDDPDLPDWFLEDENTHCQKQLPITKVMVDEYRRKLREINARPIKKIAEAKARKRHRAIKKLEKARQKAQVICDTVDVTDHEKARQIKGIYKKAGLMGRKKQDVQYVVAKKGVGKRVRRPAGVSGRFKVVDPRMKKDNRREKMQQKKKKKKR